MDRKRKSIERQQKGSSRKNGKNLVESRPDDRKNLIESRPDGRKNLVASRPEGLEALDENRNSRLERQNYAGVTMQGSNPRCSCLVVTMQER